MENYALPKEVKEFCSFDPDFGLVEADYRPLPTEDLWGKSVARLARYGFVMGDDPTTESISAEVGDDEIHVDSNSTRCALLVVFHNEMGMVTSEEDTSITTRFGNFTEELITLPDSYYQTYHNARNRNDFRDMSFGDIPKIRLAIDIRPMRMHHSATNDGKASQVGHRQSWIPHGWRRARYDVFSLYQDINLGLIRDKKFAYLPESLAGYGKRLPFNRKDNLERFIKAFRNGTHARLVRAVVRRVNRWYEEFGQGKRPEPDELLKFISRFNSGYHDWIKGQSLYAPVTWIGVPPEIAEYRSRLDSTNPLHRDIISRLLSENILVPESKVQIVHEHNEFSKGLLGKVNTLELRESITAKRKEWLKNSSIFSMEAYGYIKEITIDNEGYKPLETIETMVFMKAIDDHSLFNLRVQLRDEPVYRKEVIDKLYSMGPMMVPFSMYPKYKGYMIMGSSRMREEVIDTEELGAKEALEDWVNNGMVGPPPRTILNDDHSIIMAIDQSPSQYHCIITDDKRLCREANRKTRKPVFRVPMEWYVRFTYFGEPGEEPWIKYLRSRTGLEFTCHLDEGSFRSFEEIFFKDGMVLQRPARQRWDPFTQSRHQIKVDAEESMNFDPEAPPDQRPDTLLYDWRNTLRLKVSKQSV